MDIPMEVEKVHNPPPAQLKFPDTPKAEKEEAKAVQEETPETKNALASEDYADINNEQTVKVLGQTIRFEVTETLNVDSGATEKNLVVTVVDEETGEVIRKIPPEEVRQIRNFSRLVGVMLDQDY